MQTIHLLGHGVVAKITLLTLLNQIQQNSAFKIIWHQKNQVNIKRTVALSHESVNYLQQLKLWHLIKSTPIKQMQLNYADLTQDKYFSQKSQAKIDGWLHKSNHLAYMVCLSQLQEILQNAIVSHTAFNLIEQQTIDNTTHIETIKYYAQQKKHYLILADHFNQQDFSKHLGFKVQNYMYNHVGITQILQTKTGNHCAYQWFIQNKTSNGNNQASILALLPVHQLNTYSQKDCGYYQVVLSHTLTAHQQNLLSLDTQEKQNFLLNFIENINQKINHPILDEIIQAVDTLQVAPLQLQTYQSLQKGNCLLLGDAAHKIHPLAGQGLNLGLQDSQVLVKNIQAYQNNLHQAFKHYDQNRQFEIYKMLALTHSLYKINQQPILNRLFGLFLPTANCTIMQKLAIYMAN